MTQMKMKRLALRVVVLVLVSLACGLLFELVLRMGRLQGDQLFHPDTLLGWVHRTGFEGLYVSPEATNTVAFDEGGFVFSSTARPPRTARHRLLVLGDSFTESAQVPYDDTWPALTAHRLGLDWDVVNAGVSGYGTDQALRFLERIAHDVNPDLILLMMFTGNDLTDNDHELYSTVGLGLPKPHVVVVDGELSWVPGPTPSSAAWVPVKDWFRDHSRAYLFVRDSTHRIRVQRRDRGEGPEALPAHWVVYQHPTPPAMKRAALVTSRLLRELRSEAERLDVPLGVLLLPAAFRVEPEVRVEALSRYFAMADSSRFRPAKPDSLLSWALREAGVAHANLLADLTSARASVDSTLYGDHLTRRGHRVVANSAAELAQRLVE